MRNARPTLQTPSRSRALGAALVTVLVGCGPVEPGNVAVTGGGTDGEALGDSADAVATTVNFDDGATLVVAAHNDDELLWFQPFLRGARKVVQAVGGAAPAHYNVAQRPAYYASKLVHSYPDPSLYATDAEYVRDFLTRHPCGPISEQPVSGTLYLSQGRDLEVSYAKILAGLRPHVADPAIRRVVTHNHWGEYGHHHHRMTSDAVRQLAREYKKDVWMLSMTRLQVGVQDNSTTPGSQTYYRNEGDLYGLAHVTRTFDHALFSQQRQRYIDAWVPGHWLPDGRYTTWTWTRGTYDYPSGPRPYVRIVQGGVDRSGPTSAYDPSGASRARRIKYIKTYDAKIYGNCQQ